MLVLSRKRGEAIVIAGNITVTVLEVQGSRVKLGFAAPGDTAIHRAEVHETIMGGLPAGSFADAALDWPELTICRCPARREKGALPLLSAAVSPPKQVSPSGEKCGLPSPADAGCRGMSSFAGGSAFNGNITKTHVLGISAPNVCNSKTFRRRQSCRLSPKRP